MAKCYMLNNGSVLHVNQRQNAKSYTLAVYYTLANSNMLNAKQWQHVAHYTKAARLSSALYPESGSMVNYNILQCLQQQQITGKRLQYSILSTLQSQL